MFNLIEKLKFKRIADRIGIEIHRQIRHALTKRSKVFESPEEIMFTYAYLSTFTWVGFSKIGCKDLDIQMKYIKHICERVLPGRLWDIFKRGEAIHILIKDKGKIEFEKAKEFYDLGVDAGINDGGRFFDSGISSSKLENFFLNYGKRN